MREEREAGHTSDDARREGGVVAVAAAGRETDKTAAVNTDVLKGGENGQGSPMTIAIPTFPDFPPGQMMWGPLTGKFAHDTRTREGANLTDGKRAFANKCKGPAGLLFRAKSNRGGERSFRGNERTADRRRRDAKRINARALGARQKTRIG